MKRFTTLVAATLAAAALALAGPAAEAKPAKKFANCDAMHRVYPHGVGKPGAVDQTSGTPVTTFKRSVPLYVANAGSDRDKDGIACEAL
ncbi:excalibur calcium-binding domain-containing protein [Nocardioides anomalus]|uniref:Excalibur calcium-binding domain-containing protein n=1 Tax=Nocardioides anomalus TaxID=2712223 RepID=A0A6G6WEG5_9ACTN|nr:excalibur calcium-binding domain-containing protein [Nocardioides anomalus]QIG43495.1 excalibur calcium-binding domain-containing protein [Nocardioides anomalus]